jgi:hypothetical protein
MRGYRAVSLARMQADGVPTDSCVGAPSCEVQLGSLGCWPRIGGRENLGHLRDRRELSNGCSVNGAESFS